MLSYRILQPVAQFWPCIIIFRRFVTMITKEQKQAIVEKYGKDAQDTGSTEVLHKR